MKLSDVIDDPVNGATALITVIICCSLLTPSLRNAGIGWSISINERLRLSGYSAGPTGFRGASLWDEKLDIMFDAFIAKG